MIHLIIRFGSLERDYSFSSFNLTGLVHDSLFCYFLLLLYLSSMIHFFFFFLYHSTLSHDSDFQFHLPLCMYCLPIFYKSNLRMSIGYLQPLVNYQLQWSSQSNVIHCSGQNSIEEVLSLGKERKKKLVH